MEQWDTNLGDKVVSGFIWRLRENTITLWVENQWIIEAVFRDWLIT